MDDDECFSYASKKESKPRKQKQNSRNARGGKSEMKVDKRLQSNRDRKLARPPGREDCPCQGTVHKAITNCLECGNIVCEAQQLGPCFFCFAMVSKRGTIPAKDGNLDAQNSPNNLKSLEKARAHRDKLIGFARDQAQRTLVIDDQEDFYEEAYTNIWLGEEARSEALIKAQEEETKMNESRTSKPIRMEVDIESQTVRSAPNESIQSTPSKKSEKSSKPVSTRLPDPSKQFGNACLEGKAAEVYESLMASLPNRKKGRAPTVPDPSERRLQDDDLFGSFEDFVEDGEPPSTSSATPSTSQPAMVPEVESIYTDSTDRGVCLSMHQPWASLLVNGIKQVEGRSWATKHRGRLWIASTIRKPDPALIDEVERQYISQYGLPRELIPFPRGYPSGALLGCVDLDDCLDQESYQKRSESNEENESNHVFICSHPRVLLLPPKIKGDHKLWSIQGIGKNQQPALRKANVSWRK
eukprot:207886_1